MWTIYTVVLKRSGDHWAARCLDNGFESKGATQEDAIGKLKVAIKALDSLRMADETQAKISNPPNFRQELHNFLIMGSELPTAEVYELRLITLEDAS